MYYIFSYTKTVCLQVRMKNISLKTLSDLPQTATSILDFAKGKKIFCFYGDLGAGKTTLIKELCRQLGVTDEGSSPTFSLINEYRTATPALKGAKSQNSPSGVGGVLFHFDLYRLKNESEIYDIGYEDYIFSGNYCFIEWPEKIEKLLPKDFVSVRIEVKNSVRTITLE